MPSMIEDRKRLMRKAKDDWNLKTSAPKIAQVTKQEFDENGI